MLILNLKGNAFLGVIVWLLNELDTSSKNTEARSIMLGIMSLKSRTCVDPLI